MSQLRWLAKRGAALVAVIALPAALIIAYYAGGAHAFSFLYGVGVGLAAFASIAWAVALILGQASPSSMALGAGIYVGRLLFAAVAIVTPILLELWPVLLMVGGFVGVYVVENAVLLEGARRIKQTSGVQKGQVEG